MLELVRREQHRAVLRRRGGHDRVQHRATIGVEPGMGLVEQEQPWVARECDRDREATALPRRQPPVHDIGLAAQPQPLQRLVRLGDLPSGRPGGEPQVLPDGEVVVTEGLVAHEREVATGAPTVVGEIVAEHRGLPGIQRHQSGQQPEQRGLPGAVRTRQEDDLATGDVEVDAGQCREAPEETDGGTETDDGRHTRLRAVDAKRVYGEGSEPVEPAVRRRRRCRLASAPMRRVLGAVGRVLVTVGLLLLLFVAYQLWGTGIYQARAQGDLEQQFKQSLERNRPGTTPATSPSPTTTSTDAPATPTTLGPITVPPAGDVVARIGIPKLGVDQYVVEGVNVDDLRKGPGHYPSTQLPGHEGNAAIAGHRTTYGAPFGDLDQLVPGDRIVVTTVQGKFRYTVTEQRVVDPSEISVLDPSQDPARAGHELATLTLTTCNPKYSAEQRLIIRAQLDLSADQLPLPPASTRQGEAATSIGGLSGESSSRTPAIIWGVIAAVIGLLWWLLFHRHPRWTTWLIGVVPFLAALFVCYVYVERLLPSNY
jgi:sortase A